MESPLVRTRIAPSPTGDPHVGTAYVALVNYCFARRYGGQFILRIEDTDRARSTAESERTIMEALRWTGLRWDEGPDIGGPYGPYRQSERSAIYLRYTEELLASGGAFRCFCTPERLEDLRQMQRAQNLPTRYDGHCLTLGPQESQQRAKSEPFVVRLKVPASGAVIVDDLRRGPIEFDWSTVDMQVLLKSDGLPTYHLANVVDDHLMRITHVIRGEEWVSSAPKHLLLYQYFGWEPPKLMHVPLLRNPDKSKLSKRKNPTGILFYRQMGYLPEALLNFLGLLLVGADEGEEMFDLQQMIARFSFDHIALGGPVFDVRKLDWLNGRYVRVLTPAEMLERTRAWGFDPQRVDAIVALAQDRIERLSDLGQLTAFLFSGRLDVDVDRLTGGKIEREVARKAVALALWQLDAERDFDHPTIERVLKRTVESLGLRFKDLVRVYYVAITGSPTSLPLFESMALLGRDMCRERLRVALDTLGGVTAKEQKAWQREVA